MSSMPVPSTYNQGECGLAVNSPPGLFPLAHGDEHGSPERTPDVRWPFPATLTPPPSQPGPPTTKPLSAPGWPRQPETSQRPLMSAGQWEVRPHAMRLIVGGEHDAAVGHHDDGASRGRPTVVRWLEPGDTAFDAAERAGTAPGRDARKLSIRVKTGRT